MGLAHTFNLHSSVFQFKLLYSVVCAIFDRIVHLYVNFAKINFIYLQEATARLWYIFFASEMLSHLIA